MGAWLVGSAPWAVGEQGSSWGALSPSDLQALHGQGIEPQLISPAAPFPATLSGRARRYQSLELPRLPPRGTAPRCRGRPALGQRQDTSVLGEFKRPPDPLFSADLPNWLQHAGAADFQSPAGGCPWQRGLRGVRWGVGRAQPPATIWRRWTDRHTLGGRLTRDQG